MSTSSDQAKHHKPLSKLYRSLIDGTSRNIAPNRDSAQPSLRGKTAVLSRISTANKTGSEAGRDTSKTRSKDDRTLREMIGIAKTAMAYHRRLTEADQAGGESALSAYREVVSKLEDTNKKLSVETRLPVPSFSVSLIELISNLDANRSDLNWRLWLSEEDKTYLFRDEIFSAVSEFKKVKPKIYEEIGRLQRQNEERSRLISGIEELMASTVEGNDEQINQDAIRRFEENSNKEKVIDEERAEKTINFLLRGYTAHLSSAAGWQKNMKTPCPLSVGLDDPSINRKNAKTIAKALDRYGRLASSMSKERLQEEYEDVSSIYAESSRKYDSFNTIPDESRDSMTASWCQKVEYAARLEELRASQTE